MPRDIQIALSSDVRGFTAHATLIASVLRRTERKVHVKYWCRDFVQESFETGRLKVEFFQSGKKREGNYPSHVPSAVFDRLEVINQATEWERCLVMDHDMLVTCDLGEYFDEEFDGNLLMGRLFGSTLADAQILWRGAEFPKKWARTKKYPYFFMGPMMNLTKMRKAGTWDKILEAHAAFFAEEQIALTAATGGKVKGVNRKWNLMPSELKKDECPSGLIHWTGGVKPWQWGAHEHTWRPEIWDGERCSWLELRNGEWEKPIVWEIGATAMDCVHLASRGWNVVAVVNQREGKKTQEKPMPGLTVIQQRVSLKLIKELLEKHGAPELVRVKNARMLAWLKKAGVKSRYLIVREPGDRLQTKKIMQVCGATAWAKVSREGEPSGGRIAAGVDYSKPRMRGKAQAEEEMHGLCEAVS